VESDDEDESTEVPKHENDQVVPTPKIGHLFSKKLKNTGKEVCRNGNALLTDKGYDLSKKNGLLKVDNGDTST
jgi:hypothetical protein